MDRLPPGLPGYVVVFNRDGYPLFLHDDDYHPRIFRRWLEAEAAANDSRLVDEGCDFTIVRMP